MKYVAAVSIDEPERWHQWHCGSTATIRRSTFLNTKKEANAFIKENLRKWQEGHPDDGMFVGKWEDYVKQSPKPKYYCNTAILAISEKYSKDQESFFDILQYGHS